MSKHNINFEPEEFESTRNGAVWLISLNGQEIGRLEKHTNWNGSSWTASHYTVEIDQDTLGGEHEAIFQDFPVVGTWDAQPGILRHQGRDCFSTAREALEGSKLWTKRQVLHLQSIFESLGSPKEPWKDGVIAAIRENGWTGEITRADIENFECFFSGFMGGFDDPAFAHQVTSTIADLKTKAKIANLEEKLKNRDLNLAHRDHLIDELERKNRALTQKLESLIGKPLHLRGQTPPPTFGSLKDKPCPDCNYEEWVEQEDAKRKDYEAHCEEEAKWDAIEREANGNEKYPWRFEQ